MFVTEKVTQCKYIVKILKITKKFSEDAVVATDSRDISHGLIK